MKKTYRDKWNTVEPRFMLGDTVQVLYGRTGAYEEGTVQAIIKKYGFLPPQIVYRIGLTKLSKASKVVTVYAKEKELRKPR